MNAFIHQSLETTLQEHNLLIKGCSGLKYHKFQNIAEIRLTSSCRIISAGPGLGMISSNLSNAANRLNSHYSAIAKKDKKFTEYYYDGQRFEKTARFPEFRYRIPFSFLYMKNNNYDQRRELALSLSYFDIFNDEKLYFPSRAELRRQLFTTETDFASLVCTFFPLVEGAATLKVPPSTFYLWGLFTLVLAYASGHVIQRISNRIMHHPITKRAKQADEVISMIKKYI